MQCIYRFFLVSLLGVMALSGCRTFEPHRPAGDFVRSTNFSPLETFSYQATLVSSTPLRDDQEAGLLEISERVLSDELRARGFEAVESGGDFYVVTKWHQKVRSDAGVFDAMDGANATMTHGGYTPYQAAVRFTLAVELYESASGALFWRAELPNIFDAIQYSEARVAQSLVRAIQNFPQRVEKDPNLPNIE